MIEGGDSYSEDDDFEHESSVEHVSESKVAESLQETGVSAAGSQDPGPAVAAFRPAQRSPAQAQLRSQSVSPAGSTDPAARVRAATLRKLQRENRDLLERLRRTRSGPEVQLPTALVVHASRNGRQGWSPSPPRRARPESPADDISRFPSELASKYLDIRKKLRGAHTAWELLKQEYDALVARAAEVERVECVSDLLNRLGELDMRLGELRTENSTLKKEGKRIGRAASSYKPEGDAFEATVQRLRREISQARAEQKKSAAAVKAAQGEQDKVHSQMVRLKGLERRLQHSLEVLERGKMLPTGNTPRIDVIAGERSRLKQKLHTVQHKSSSEAQRLQVELKACTAKLAETKEQAEAVLSRCRTLEERKGMLIDMAQELVAAINKARGRGASSPPKSNGDHAGDAFVTQDDVGEAM